MTTSLPRAYFETRFQIEGEPSSLPPVFAILTAFYPMDEVTSPEANTAADALLESALRSAGHEPVRVTGTSPDRSHEEPGWAINCPLEEALLIARQFRQRAIWWIENDELRLVDCGNPTPLPVAWFSERIQTP
ncbi:DUF3293 domain-containing protein [Haloferula sp.]|uniref:DUF3293 domain-containing protein n=1 Tax=Haloferula sp. TaxID=2497595 RepID=UPI003C7620A3